MDIRNQFNTKIDAMLLVSSCMWSYANLLLGRIVIGRKGALYAFDKVQRQHQRLVEHLEQGRVPGCLLWLLLVLCPAACYGSWSCARYLLGHEG